MLPLVALKRLPRVCVQPAACQSAHAANANPRGALSLNFSETVSFAGVADLAPLVGMARNAIVLEAPDLIAIRNTLISARDAKRIIINRADELPPHLAGIAEGLTDGAGLIDLINRTITERGEVLDSASPALGGKYGGAKSRSYTRA